MDMDDREKEAGWLAVNQVRLVAGLYLIATPIGNLRDMTLRALDTIAAVDVLYCEDTRVTGKLLQAYQLKKKMVPYNDHADTQKRDEILAKIENGEAVGLVSDAGLPLISDPGFKLVRACVEKGLSVTTIPGASAPLSALQISGAPSDVFSFIGFLPAKEKARRDVLQCWKTVESTVLAFETAPRLQAALRDIDHVLGDRVVSVARELTKMYEEVKRGTAQELLAYYEEEGRPKGEIVLVIEPPEAAFMSEEEVIAHLGEALRTMRVKEAAGVVAEMSGLSKSAVYEMALKIKG